MTYPLSEIDGLSAYCASKLKAQGIRTTDALLEAARTVKGRKALAAKTGISEQQLLEWANVSDYMRIPGMGKAKGRFGPCRRRHHRSRARAAQSVAACAEHEGSEHQA
ncbi:hypothetical protein ACVJGD_009227 [Bradyrhizobium sp. USDA 10063]